MNALLFVSLLALAAPGSKATKAKASEPAKKELLRRAISITDETTEVPVSISMQSPTTLTFPQKVKSVFCADVHGYFGGEKVHKEQQFVLLRPIVDLPQGEVLTLQVQLEDGTSLPPILLSTAPTSMDLYVTITVALARKASEGSATALKVQLAEMQSRIDECEQSAGERGAVKVAELVLKQDPRKPASFVVEKHPSRSYDKQSRLLVETLHVYRLFDASYLVLTIENRDPDKLWVLERAEIAIEGSSTVEARVLDVAQEMAQGIPPAEEAKLVIAFKTPEQAVDHTYTLKLFEKSGNRHVTLSSLKF